MFTTHRPTLTFQLHNFDLFRTCPRPTALLRGNWQDFNSRDASRGPSAIAELLVPLWYSLPGCHGKEAVLMPVNTFSQIVLHRVGIVCRPHQTIFHL